MERPPRLAKLAKDFKEVDTSYVLTSAQLCHEGPSVICPGRNAI